MNCLLLALIGLAPAEIDAASAVALMPATSEFIICSQTPSTLGPSTYESALSKQLPLMGLTLLAIRRDKWELKCDFLVEAGRNVRPPSRLGVQRFEGCSIIGLAPAERQRWLAEAKRAKKKMVIGGTTFYLKEQLSEADTWQVYTGFTQNVMIIGSDRRFLAEVLARLTSKKSDSLAAFKRMLPYVDRRSPFWAVRRFTERTRKPLFGLNMGDDKIVGYALTLSADRSKLTVTSVSDSSAGFERAEKL
jgi:hypothetical protein